MHRRRRPSRSATHAATVVAACSALLVAGCGAGETAVGPTPSATTQAVTNQAAAPVRAESRYLACVDVTTSVPGWFVKRALHQIAADVEAAVTGPMEPATFYLRSTTSASYAPDAELLTVRLPPVGSPPPAPEPSPNIYEKAANDKALAVHGALLAEWAAGLAEAQRVAAEEADRVRGLAPQPDSTGTDILGCPLRATSLLGHDGDRHLVIFSDLVPSGRQQTGLPAGSLTGITVTIAFYCAELARACAERLAAFSTALSGAGVTAVEVIDPQNLET